MGLHSWTRMQRELDKDLERITIRSSIVGSYKYHASSDDLVRRGKITLHDDGRFWYETSEEWTEEFTYNELEDKMAKSDFTGTWELELPNIVKILTWRLSPPRMRNVDKLGEFLPSSALTWTPDRTLTWVEPTHWNSDKCGTMRM